jgi:hypothetical protein
MIRQKRGERVKTEIVAAAARMIIKQEVLSHEIKKKRVFVNGRIANLDRNVGRLQFGWAGPFRNRRIAAGFRGRKNESGYIEDHVPWRSAGGLG